MFLRMQAGPLIEAASHTFSPVGVPQAIAVAIPRRWAASSHNYVFKPTAEISSFVSCRCSRGGGLTRR